MIKRLKVSGKTVEEIILTPDEEAEFVAKENAQLQAEEDMQTQRAAIESSKAEVKSDAFVQAFKDMTPAQVLTHVGKISNLAEAKELLAKFGIILLVVAKDQLD